MAKNRAEGPAVEFAVIRYGERGRWISAENDHVAALLAVELEANLAKHANEIATGNDRQLAQTQTT